MISKVDLRREQQIINRKLLMKYGQLQSKKREAPVDIEHEYEVKDSKKVRMGELFSENAEWF